MTFGAFVRDRRAYIAAYAAFGLLTVTVVQLDLRLTGASLRMANLGYLFLLGIVGLALYLWHDFRRQAGFFRRLSVAAASESFDQMGVLNEPHTWEQGLYFKAWSTLFARLSSEIAREQERGRERVHVVTQWAHHMKTPVSVISLELQKARNAKARFDAEALIRSVAEETDRLDHLLQMLLNTVRLDDFTNDFRIERVDLPSLVRRVINENRSAFIAHRVYPRLELPENGSPFAGAFCVESDAKWLQIVLDQVLSNAVKYASRPDRDGNVVVRIRQAGEVTELEVADDGVGVAPEDAGRVFRPFFTGANGRTHTRSTGMGLYLANEACRRLGHALALRSTPGQGTQVTIRFRTGPTIHTDVKHSI